jgi:hypothetical protein
MIFTFHSCAVAVIHFRQIATSSAVDSVGVVMKIDVKIVFEEQIMIKRDFIDAHVVGRHCKRFGRVFLL